MSGRSRSYFVKNVLASSFRRQIASQLAVDEAQAGRLVAFLIALHDLGKANPAYQRKYSPDWLKTKLEQQGFSLDKEAYNTTTNEQYHGVVSAWAMPTYLESLLGFESDAANKIGIAVGGHHGLWPAAHSYELLDDSAFPAWQTARNGLVTELYDLFAPPRVHVEWDRTTLNVFLTLLAGLTTVADWVGSHEDYFEFEEMAQPTAEYAAVSAERAHDALHSLGWLGWQPTQATIPFSKMFAHLNPNGGVTPRPLQEKAIELAKAAQSPTLLILEAPTGIGKTETAFCIADDWLQTQQLRGLYIAMPTQATSNQMFDRTVDFCATAILMMRSTRCLHTANGV